MQKIFIFQQKPYKQLIKKRMKEELKTKGNFVKFCNFLYWFIIVGTIISAIVSVYYNMNISDSPYDWIMLIVTVLFPLLLSFLPRAVVVGSIGDPYKFHENFVLSVVQGNLLYSYEMAHHGYIKDILMIPIEEINEIEYNQKLQLITIRGEIKQEFYHNGSKINNTCSAFDFVNSYNEDVFLFLKSFVSPYCRITVI